MTGDRHERGEGAEIVSAWSHITRRCERAVVTAYRELREGGSPDLAAFRACTALYRIHHPEASVAEARLLVSEWIDHHVIRAGTGPTEGCDCPEA